MIIGVHILGENIEQHFLFAAIKQISINNPTDNFIIFTEKKLEGLSPNCQEIIISPKPKNKAGRHLRQRPAGGERDQG